MRLSSDDPGAEVGRKRSFHLIRSWRTQDLRYKSLSGTIMTLTVSYPVLLRDSLITSASIKHGECLDCF